MTSLSRAALLATLLVALAGCGAGEPRRGDPDLQIRVEVEPHPPTLGEADVEVRVADVDWSPRNGDRVLIHALRDGVVLARDTAVGRGAGLYRAEDVPFPVAGDWLLTVRVETRDGRWAEVDRRLEVVPEG